ncbi:hypothetical protein B7486_12940 [cyanobacterium TDX16]|nr:hypothetical protein B7486_12940 [cyanobacterium TDX16]
MAGLALGDPTVKTKGKSTPRKRTKIVRAETSDTSNRKVTVQFDIDARLWESWAHRTTKIGYDPAGILRAVVINGCEVKTERFPRWLSDQFYVLQFGLEAASIMVGYSTIIYTHAHSLKTDPPGQKVSFLKDVWDKFTENARRSYREPEDIIRILMEDMAHESMHNPIVFDARLRKAECALRGEEAASAELAGAA